MSPTSPQPRKDDAVLGDRTPTPPHASVLGGIGGVKKRLSSSDEREQNIVLENAFKYGRIGLEIVIATFNDKRPNVARKA